jgi:tRNA U34 2-thiouridine synthase MnmA/TrmU
VIFSKSQRAIVPGQIMAFYEGGRLLGGGVVENVG